LITATNGFVLPSGSLKIRVHDSQQGMMIHDRPTELAFSFEAVPPEFESTELATFVSAPTFGTDVLTDPEGAFAEIAGQDWSFTGDDTRHFTHDVHPYPAKFIPQIPANLIPRLSREGDVVLDPFGGSGTTAVEAVRLRRRAISLDANPLSSLIGRVKTGLPQYNRSGRTREARASGCPVSDRCRTPHG